MSTTPFEYHLEHPDHINCQFCYGIHLYRPSNPFDHRNDSDYLGYSSDDTIARLDKEAPPKLTFSDSDSNNEELNDSIVEDLYD